MNYPWGGSSGFGGEDPQQRRYEICKVNCSNYIKMITQYLNYCVDQGDITDKGLYDKLRNDLVSEVKQNNSVVWNFMWQRVGDNQLSDRDLWKLVDQRRKEFQATYDTVDMSGFARGGVPNNPFASNGFGGSSMGSGSRRFNRSSNMNFNMSSDCDDGSDSLERLFGHNSRQQRVTNTYSPRPTQTMEQSRYQEQDQPRRRLISEPKPEVNVPSYRQNITNISYRTNEIPDYEFNNTVGSSIPESFMTARAAKIIISANGVVKGELKVVDAEMKDVVKDLSEVKDNLNAADINVDNKTVVVAAVDRVETVKGDNAEFTKAFNRINDKIVKMDKTNIVDVATVIMCEIESCGNEFRKIIEPQICKMFNSIMKIVLNYITSETVTCENPVNSFEEIEQLLEHVGKPYDIYTDTERFGTAMKAAVNGSMLSIFGIKGSKRTLDITNKDDKKVLMDNQNLPIFVDNKPYRCIYGETLSQEQLTQVDEGLKKIFSYKIRQTILLHSIPEFGFTYNTKLQTSIFDEDELHRTLLMSLIERAMNGFIYMNDITQTKSSNPLLLVAQDYNGIYEASEV